MSKCCQIWALTVDVVNEATGKMKRGNDYSYGVGDRALFDEIESILAKHEHRSPSLARLKLMTYPIPAWAFVFLARDYDVSGHLCRARTDKEGIRFSPYRFLITSLAPGYKPRAGMFTVFDREALRGSANNSLIFKMAWEILHDKPNDSSWLVILDPLPEDWIREQETIDQKLWEQIQSQVDIRQ